MQTLDECSGKVIIWATYIHSIEEAIAAISKEYGPESVVSLYGATPDKERRVAVDRLQKDPTCRFFVANPATGGFGITLTAADVAIFYTNSWNLEHRAQAEDRIHRIGQRRPCTYVDLVCEGTIDEKILKALRHKIDLAAAVMRDGPKEWLQ
jgi:SNF2 family DNA or RNA helicase